MFSYNAMHEAAQLMCLTETQDYLKVRLNAEQNVESRTPLGINFGLVHVKSDE